VGVLGEQGFVGAHVDVLVNYSFDFCFSQETSVEPVDLVIDLSDANAHRLVDALPQHLDFNFNINALPKNINQAVPSVVRHVVGRVPMLHFVSYRVLSGQQLICKLPDTKPAVLIAIVPVEYQTDVPRI